MTQHKKTCRSCRNLLPVDRSDRFAFDNYSDCCAEDGEGHDKNQEACDKYKEHEQGGSSG